MKAAERLQARALRANGLSLRDIALELQVARSTVSSWVRDIVLTAEQQGHLAAKMTRGGYVGRCNGARMNRESAEKQHLMYRENGYERAKADDQFRLICALYWGEGSKSMGSVFAVSNSDPRLLNVFLRWLIAEGYDEAVRFCVQYHPTNGLSEKEIQDWWLEHLQGLKARHMKPFSVCRIHRASQQKHVGKLPYGTGRLYVCRTELLYRIFGGIDWISETGA
jgi:hypothetical protein